jgi:hypothetical protein
MEIQDLKISMERMHEEKIQRLEAAQPLYALTWPPPALTVDVDNQNRPLRNHDQQEPFCYWRHLIIKRSRHHHHLPVVDKRGKELRRS